MLVATPRGVVVQLSEPDWKELLVRDLAWQALFIEAKKCEVP